MEDSAMEESFLKRTAPSWMPTTHEEVQTIVVGMFCIELFCAPLFYLMGYLHMFKEASIGTGVFLAASVFVQLHLGRSPFFKKQFAEHNVPLESMMGLPVRWSGFKRWQYLFITSVPNYAHILSTAVAAGGRVMGVLALPGANFPGELEHRAFAWLDYWPDWAAGDSHRPLASPFRHTRSLHVYQLQR